MSCIALPCLALLCLTSRIPHFRRFESREVEATDVDPSSEREIDLLPDHWADARSATRSAFKKGSPSSLICHTDPTAQDYMRIHHPPFHMDTRRPSHCTKLQGRISPTAVPAPPCLPIELPRRFQAQTRPRKHTKHTKPAASTRFQQGSNKVPTTQSQLPGQEGKLPSLLVTVPVFSPCSWGLQLDIVHPCGLTPPGTIDYSACHQPQRWDHWHWQRSWR